MHNKLFTSTQKNILTTLLFAICLTACSTGNSSQLTNATPSAANNFSVTDPHLETLANTAPVIEVSATEKRTPAIDPSWETLISRLAEDGFPPEVTDIYFDALPAFSGEPMAVKVKELHTNAFLRKKTPKKPSDTPAIARIYKGFVTKASVALCEEYLKEHEAYFETMEQRYGIPREIIVSLLYVETKLGTYLGGTNALWSLASMAAASSPELIATEIAPLQISKEKHTWLTTKVTEKSDWAYNELKALLTHCNEQQLEAQDLPGSVYGAIGICQFMPSNLSRFGVDGNGDGIVNLFDHADAIHSAANYLYKHKWTKNCTVPTQRSVLKRYNNLTTYANTIITLAESISTKEIQSMPSDAKAELEQNKKKNEKKNNKTKPTGKTQKKKKQPQ